MKYTDLDYVAYDLYLKAVEKNPPRSIDIYGKMSVFEIDDSYVGNMCGFVEWSGKHYNNMKFYYDGAILELRKQKLKKINKL